MGRNARGEAWQPMNRPARGLRARRLVVAIAVSHFRLPAAASALFDLHLHQPFFLQLRRRKWAFLFFGSDGWARISHKHTYWGQAGVLVHVHSGGEAVVGMVGAPGGGAGSPKLEHQRHAKQIAYAPHATLVFRPVGIRRAADGVGSSTTHSIETSGCRCRGVPGATAVAVLRLRGE
jgi:hypothetical protein